MLIWLSRGTGREKKERKEDTGLGDKYGGVKITATVECFASTGVEMEALTAVAVAGLAMVDMCKGVDRGMVLGNVRVVSKRGVGVGVIGLVTVVWLLRRGGGRRRWLGRERK